MTNIKKKISTEIFSYKYEVLFWIISFIRIVKDGYFPGNNSYVSSFYFNAYEFGFIKRGLIGEIFTKISPYTTWKTLSSFKLCFLIFFYIWLGLLIGKFVRKQEDERIRWLLLLFIAALPSTFIFVSDDMRLDAFLCVLFILSALIVLHDRFLWIIPIILVHMLLINETSCTYYLPVICAMLIYKFLNCRSQKYIWTFVFSLLFSIPLCMLFLLREDPRLTYEASQISTHISKHTDVKLAANALESEFWPFSRILQAMSNYLNVHLLKSILFILLLVPAFLLLFSIWRAIYRKAEVQDSNRNAASKRSVYLLALSPLFGFIPMLISIDIPRYISFFINSILITIIFFMREKNIQITFCDLHIGKKKISASENIFPIMVCVFYLLFGPFKSTVYSTPFLSRITTFFAGVSL